jgi:PKD domain
VTLFRIVALSPFLLIALLRPSVSHADGGAKISFGFGNTPGVVARAQTFLPGSAGNGDDPTRHTPLDSGSTYSALYTPTVAPDAGEFLSSEFADIPNPCGANTWAGSYCRRIARNHARWPGPGAPPPVAPSPSDIARSAFDRAISLAPSPELSVAPADIGLTGLDSYFWLEDPPTAISASAGVPGLTVTASASPVQFVWDFGDGNDKVTETSGTPWTPHSDGDISHLYETKGIYDLSVEVIWAASYRINGGPPTSLGYFSTSDTRTYPVREMVAVLVPSD